MGNLPTMGDRVSGGLPGSLGASMVGLIAGAAIMAAVAGGLFGGDTPATIPAERTAKIPTLARALNDRVDTLEELNAFYLSALVRMNESQPSSIVPPPELGQIYDAIVSRVVVEALSLDEINAMFDAAIREAVPAA